MGRCDIVIAAESIYSLDVKSGDGLADRTLDGIRQVGTNLRSGLHRRQSFFEKVRSRLIVSPTLGGLFSHHVVSIILVFVFNRLAVH